MIAQVGQAPMVFNSYITGVICDRNPMPTIDDVTDEAIHGQLVKVRTSMKLFQSYICPYVE